MKTLQKSTKLIALLLLFAVIISAVTLSVKNASANEIDVMTLENNIIEIAEQESLATGAKIAPHYMRSEGNINFGITSYGATANEARKECMTVMNSLMKSVSALGIDTDNISYYNYSCYPEKDKHGDVRQYFVCVNISISLENMNQTIRMPRHPQPELFYK